MVVLYEIKLVDILTDLPNIEELDIKKCLVGRTDDLFLCALGFEDRCPWIPERLNEAGGYSAKESIYFEYETNIDDNNINKIPLISALKGLSESVRPIQFNGDDFTVRFREILKYHCKSNTMPHVTFDISVCSSRLLLLSLKVLFEFNLNLRILYSEAAVYHPLKEEYEKCPEKWTSNEHHGLAKGVAEIIPSPEHPGNRRDRQPESVVVFPTFKPERTKSIILEIDQSLAITIAGERVTWIVGVPHVEEDKWRTIAMRAINQIPESSPSYEICTFEYKKTLEVLEKIYHFYDSKYHFNISPLGSKMQTLGVALFWYMRQEVSMVFAVPREYNAQQYSEGCKGAWQIYFGNLDEVKDTLSKVGQLKIYELSEKKANK